MRLTSSLGTRLGIALSTGALLLATAAPASAWSTTTTITSSITQPLLPRLAVNSKGASAVAWGQSYNGHWNLKLRVRSASGTWSAVRNIASNIINYQVAMDAAGNTYVQWPGLQSGGLVEFVRVLSASGSLSSTTSFPHASNGAAFNAQGVVAGPSGVAYVYGWGTESRNYGQAEVRRVDSAGHVGPAQYLSELPDSQVSIDNVSAGIDAAGNLTVAWDEVAQSRVDGRGVVKARQLATDGTLGPIKQISTSGVLANDPQVAIMSSGGGIVGWHDTKQRFRRVTAAGAFTTATAVQTSGANLAISPKGILAATWISGYGTSRNSVYVRTVSAAGTVGAYHLLASAPYIPQADTAIDATGRTLSIVCIGSCDDYSSSIRVRAIPFGGSPGATTTLTNSSHAGGAVALVPSLGKFRIAWNSGSRLLTKTGP